MTVADDRVPVIVATGQVVERENPVGTLDLAERAARMALDAAPALAARLDHVSVVSMLTPGGAGPVPASTLAGRLGLRPARCETTTIGGNTPQWLVTRAAAAIARGERDGVLIVGGEAMRSAKVARGKVPRGPAGDPADPIVGDDRFGSSEAEMSAGLLLPTHVYPMLESVRARRAGRTMAEQRAWIATWFAAFTEVAAKHPCAWFPETRTPTELATPSADNRLVAEPYTKRMNAVLEVDQAAAVMVCSLASARAAGVADGAVFVWSGADANDVFHVSARPDLGASPGIAAATHGALAAAQVGVDDVALFDLYSCFPVAVAMAADALALAVDDTRGLTVTGGLPYFGGPGNAYTLHGIATMVDRLRETGGRGLTTGLGWFVTKHSAGLYGTEPPPLGFVVADTGEAQRAIDASAVPVASSASGPATIDAATIAYGPDGIANAAPAIATTRDGERVPVRARMDDLASLAGDGLVGASVHIEGNEYHVEGMGP
jgi:acetyl-CoA C-acetyltransferase